jgi:hypothetical protein
MLVKQTTGITITHLPSAQPYAEIKEEKPSDSERAELMLANVIATLQNAQLVLLLMRLGILTQLNAYATGHRH